MNKIEKKVKNENYQKLFNKIPVALKEEFYFEAIWIAFSIMEDRLLSALKKTGGDKYLTGESDKDKLKGKKAKMLGNKIDLLNERKKDNDLLKKFFYDSFLDEISAWSKSRNKLMHALATETIPLYKHNKEIYLTAMKGEELAKELATRLRRLNKSAKKVKVK